MVTREQLETALDSDNKDPFKEKGIDHGVTVINLPTMNNPENLYHKERAYRMG